MRRQLLDLFQAFTYGLFCVSLFVASIWFAKTYETSPNHITEASFEKLNNSNRTAYLDWENIFVSGSSTRSFSSQEKNKNQSGEHSCFFGYKSISNYQSFFNIKIFRELKCSSLLDQLHNILFFF